MHAVKGVGQDHAKFSPVGKAPFLTDRLIYKLRHLIDYYPLLTFFLR